jgi:hypothetical protein
VGPIHPWHRVPRSVLVFLNVTTNGAELERALRLAIGKSNDHERIRKRTDKPLQHFPREVSIPRVLNPLEGNGGFQDLCYCIEHKP